MAGTISGGRGPGDDPQTDAGPDGGRVSREGGGRARGEAEGGGAHGTIPRGRPERDDLRSVRRPRRDAIARGAGRAAMAVGERAVNRSPARLYGLALLAGLAPAALLASTCVAFQYGYDPALGRPLWWRLYDPLAVVRWASSWGLTPGYRAGFLSGLCLDVIVWLLPAAAVRVREMRGSLAPEERPAGSRLGTAADLKALGGFGHHGPGIVVGLDGRRPLFSTGDVHGLVLGPTRTG